MTAIVSGYRCPACARVVNSGIDFVDHFHREPEHRGALVAEAAKLDPPTVVDHHCMAYDRIVRDLDAGERSRFLLGADCQGPRFDCACGNTTCRAHTIVCRRCGRPMCPRHRYTAQCEICTGRSKPRLAIVDKHDPFSKTTTKVTRTYRRPVQGVWPPVDPGGYEAPAEAEEADDATADPAADD